MFKTVKTGKVGSVTW